MLIDSAPQLLVQVTAVLVVLLTVAAKVCIPPANRFAVGGATWIATGGTTVTVAWAVWAVFAVLVAVTVQVVAEAGAVNVAVWDPVPVMVPQLAPHLTARFVLPVTVALNDSVCDSTNVAEVGEIVMLTLFALSREALSAASRQSTGTNRRRTSRGPWLRRSSSNTIIVSSSKSSICTG